MAKSGSMIFSVKPRLLRLLGDQLIRDANLAVFELVKNAYDADATNCRVVLEYPDDHDHARIVVEDNGSGMSEATLRNVWMVIATDHRAEQRLANKRSPRFGRFPLGEKGLGRLSIHKLGRFIQLVTRTRRGSEFVVEFDWDRLENAKDLRRANVILRKRKPQTFIGDAHGTRLIVSKLRETWARGEVRRLHRAVNALCSPFNGPTDFNVDLAVPGRESWLEGMFSSDEAAKCATYRISGFFEGSTAQFQYKFQPPVSFSNKLNERAVDVVIEALSKKQGRQSVPIDLSPFEIGKVEFEMLLFDRDPAVIRAVTDDVKGLKDYLDENGGIRVYRDGIRVYDFGEPGNDWLNLDLRRVNTPSARTSNNQILGALRLDSTTSSDLREKSNREGFIENLAYAEFRNAVTSVLTNIEAEKTKDQRRLREALGKGTGQKIFSKLAELRDVLASKGVLEAVEPRLREVEKEMEIYRDQLLHAAVPGLSIGIMLHGVEKTVEELREAARRNADPERIKFLIDQLYRGMRPVTNLLKNPGVGKTSAMNLVREAIFSTELRLQRHGITLSVPTSPPDFEILGSKQMLIASITNLIDNAIHWLEIKGPEIKRLYISPSKDLDGGPAIIVADNGPGFGDDDPEDLVAPFFTRRNGGMGLGLYIVSEVMRVNKGRLIFPSRTEANVPPEYSGAITALQFGAP
jgi:signal transduction histidine kinase